MGTLPLYVSLYFSVLGMEFILHLIVDHVI